MSINQEERQNIINSLISEWEYMKSSFTREDLVGEDNESSGIDVRLQVLDDEGLLDWSSLQLHTGKADTDTNYQGYWGDGFLDYDWDRDELEANIKGLVDDLISQVEGAY